MFLFAFQAADKLAAQSVIEVSRNSEERAGDRIQLDVAEKYGSTTITVKTKLKKNEQLSGAFIQVYFFGDSGKPGKRKQWAKIPVSIQSDSNDQSIIRFQMLREFAPKCRLSIAVHDTSTAAPTNVTTYVVDIASYFDKVNEEEKKQVKPIADIELLRKKLLGEYRGDVRLPDSLVSTFSSFAQAAKAGDAGKLQTFLLPGGVQISTASRPENNREYGVGINLPFLKSGFHGEILNLRKLGDEAFLIRTGSSYIRFIKTASGKWLIYDFGDKPIE